LQNFKFYLILLIKIVYFCVFIIFFQNCQILKKIKMISNSSISTKSVLNSQSDTLRDQQQNSNELNESNIEVIKLGTPHLVTRLLCREPLTNGPI
jgi:hypothetical protein